MMLSPDSNKRNSLIAYLQLLLFVMGMKHVSYIPWTFERVYRSTILVDYQLECEIVQVLEIQLPYRIPSSYSILGGGS